MTDTKPPAILVALMVCDEQASIPETIGTLRAVLPNPRIVVFDTSKGDETARAAEACGAEVRVDVPWLGRYDASYNGALAACEALAEPDDWIVHAYGRRLYSGMWAPPEGAELVTSTEHWSAQCDATRVVGYRARLECRYQGATHERLRYPTDRPTPDSGIRLTRHACDHPRPDRFLRDLALLEGETDPRSRFYYAQTLAALDRHPEAYGAYLARADMQGQGDDNEVVVSLWRAMHMAPRHPSLLPVVTRMCHGALSIDERRGEPWQALAEYCLELGCYELAGRYAALALTSEPDPRCLFLDPTVHTRALAMLEALDSALSNLGRARSSENGAGEASAPAPSC